MAAVRAPEGPANDPSEIRRPWRPAAVPDVPDAAFTELSYAVVDEIVGTLTTLAVSSWPGADGYGRLRFDRAADRGPRRRPPCRAARHAGDRESCAMLGKPPGVGNRPAPCRCGWRDLRPSSASALGAEFTAAGHDRRSTSASL